MSVVPVDPAFRRHDDPLSLLRKLTIIVFTRSRPAYALRQANFWGARDPTLFIFDNGEEPWEPEVIAGLTSNVHYFHDKGGYYRQMRTSGRLVETEYAVLIDDDNFLIEDGLEACILELEDRPQLIAVMGQAAVLRYLRGHVILEPAYPENFCFSNDSPEIEERIFRKLNPYRQTGWYAVQRSTAFRDLLPVVSDVSKETACAYVSEVCLELGLILLGATTTVPNLTVLRSVENPPEDDSGHSRILYFQDWWLDERYQIETALFVSSLKRLAPNEDASVWLFMVNELNRFAHKPVQRARPTIEAAILSGDLPAWVRWVFNKLPLGQLRALRWKLQFGLRLAPALLCHPVNRNRGFIGMTLPRKVKARPSANLFDSTPGLTSVVDAVQRFYSTPQEESTLDPS